MEQGIIVALIAISFVLLVIFFFTKDDKDFKMKNFPVKVKGKEFWISRSCAVVGIVYKYNKETGEVYVLTNKRGKGCPDYVGYWNIPCGYVDYDETLEEAVSREVFEETGLKVDPNSWKLYGIKSTPDTEKQSISVRYITAYKEEMGDFDYSHQEKNEVDEIKWISLDDVDNYQWAFEQINLLNEIKTQLNKEELL
jgi:8-oxo-dGTP pyrophosphatase MutT (NUDIX family)